MRIIAGERKGHVLAAPRGMKTRPTLGRVRESLFAILGELVVDARVADLYAGAGGLGLEALSRGAASCVFVEKSRPALAALEHNIAKLAYAGQSRIEPRDVMRWLHAPRTTQEEMYDLVFVDPPYAMELAHRTMCDLGGFAHLSPQGVVIAQCGSREPLLESYGGLKRYRQERYGDTAVHFYKRNAPADLLPD